MNKFPTYQRFGDSAVLIRWENEISSTINSEVIEMEAYVKDCFSEEIIETVPTYNSLAIYLKYANNVTSFLEKVRSIKEIDSNVKPVTRYIVYIPVCYEQGFAMDLEALATRHELTPSEVVTLHTEASYRVYFNGFLPGFPYLGGLPIKLHTARKKTPRLHIEAGSVAIGGGQTGIYTIPSPGGWNIIGRCPLRFFSSEITPVSMLQAGDEVKFIPITSEAFKKIENEVASNTYIIRKELRYD
ncbi:5-oxoprolinase subunit PxpB [Ulvibacter antarcticus]|uniref:KipI family sensor histidine kinase inhibitor n=1 Tax=Ulvibacter antarcticus TaxID=442714 RepID=A0A3L9YH23_9FLAO|nr:5-oxoprolinase subunit PxpB [Ulvibacter antarcticus]RMA58857.1 KipI family sensor histidine kinase inhibitor [Ulvibacter antarcticus]